VKGCTKHTLFNSLDELTRHPQKLFIFLASRPSCFQHLGFVLAAAGIVNVSHLSPCWTILDFGHAGSRWGGDSRSLFLFIGSLVKVDFLASGR